MSVPDLPDWQTKIALQVDVQLYSGPLLAGGFTPDIDASPYNSLVIETATAVVGHARWLIVQWLDSTGTEILRDVITAPAQPGINYCAPVVVPIRAEAFSVINASADDMTAVIYGSQRPATGLVSAGYADVQHFEVNQAWVANQVVALSSGSTGIASQGWHQLHWRVQGTTVTGYLVALYYDVNFGAQNFVLADTGECHTFSGDRRLYKQVILPASLTVLRFVCDIGGAAATVAVDLAALGR